MPDTVFTTQRLIVRRWRDADLPALLAVYGDADAMRWVGDGQPLGHGDVARWLAVTRNNYAQRGYGMLAVERQQVPGVIGFCGLVHPGGQALPEIKYAYLRNQWGAGYATEAAVGLIGYGASQLGLRHIIATTDPANTASHRVLIKAGLARGALRENDDGSLTLPFNWTAGG